MAYDSARRRTVLFGGQDSGQRRLADTWEWDGKAWTQLKPIQSPQVSGHAMVYDSTRKRTVLFGNRQTWEWDGRAWTQMKPKTSPSNLFRPAIAYDSIQERTVIYGSSETWEWDGKTWMRILTNRPNGGGPMVFQPARQRALLFTGKETWEYGDLIVAKFIPFGKTCGPTLAAAGGSRPIVGTTFTMVSSNLPSTTLWAVMSAGASTKLFGAIPLPISLDFLGMKGCFLYHSFDLTWAFPAKNGVGRFSIPIPNNRNLAGTTVYFQSFAWPVASNAGAAFVGSL